MEVARVLHLSGLRPRGGLDVLGLLIAGALIVEFVVVAGMRIHTWLRG